MLDEIYFRLLMELAPEPLKPRPLDAERIVNNFGMSEESRDAYGHLVGSIYENDPSSDIGLHYGRLLRPYALCDFSRALMTAPSFGNAMQIINDLHYMQGASYYLTTFESSDSISIALNYPYKKNVSEHQRRFCAEAVFIYLVNLARDSLCHSISPCKVWLDFDKPSYADAYSELFGLNIEFNAPLSILEFKNELSDVGLKTSNHTLHKTYIKKCVDSARNAERYWSFDYRTSTQLIRHLPDSFNGSTLSTILSISPRGLQKKLSLLGTSFSELSSQARIELAKVFLIQQNKSIETTSELLGFQTISGFRRFFKSELGMTTNELIASAPENAAIQNLL